MAETPGNVPQQPQTPTDPGGTQSTPSGVPSGDPLPAPGGQLAGGEDPSEPLPSPYV